MAKHKRKQHQLQVDTLACGVKMMNHFNNEMLKTIQKAVETRQRLKDKYGKQIVQLF